MRRSPPQPLPVTYFSPSEAGVRFRRRRRAKPAVAAARLERERSEGLLEEAKAIVHDLQRIRHENHFAESLRKLVEGE
jgi:hypothetical protein